MTEINVSTRFLAWLVGTSNKSHIFNLSEIGMLCGKRGHPHIGTAVKVSSSLNCW